MFDVSTIIPMMDIKVIKTKAKNLQPGDLFSSMGKVYWNMNNIRMHKSLGEKIYIRTEEPCPKDQENVTVYKIIIKKGGKNQK